MADPGRIPGPKVVRSCAQIQIFWAMPNSKNASISLYGRYAGAFNVTQTMIDAFFSAVVAAYTSSGMAALAPTNVILGAAAVRDINTAKQALIQNSSAVSGTPGTSAGLALPPQVALVVTLRTALAGQANRGRLYIPGWADNATTVLGVATPAAVTAAGTFAQSVRTALLNNLSMTNVIAQVARAGYTGKTGTVHAPRTDQSVVVTQSVVRDNIFDTQRRRSKP